MPLDPSGLPEFDDRSLLAHREESLRKQVEEGEAECQALRSAATEHAKQTAQLEAKISHLQLLLREQDTRHLDEIRHLRSALRGAEGQLQTQSKDIDELNVQLKQAEQQADESKTQNELRDSDVSRHVQRAEAAEAAAATARGELAVAKANANEYFHRLTAALQHGWDLEAQLQKAQRETAGVAAAIGNRCQCDGDNASSGNTSKFEVRSNAAAGQVLASLQSLRNAQDHEIRETSKKSAESRGVSRGHNQTLEAGRERCATRPRGSGAGTTPKSPYSS
eukprot:INCI14135.2.p1 GENE.INCI14135.2~~INCI14135.2.p1  ORF type:complete len:279 (+),score=60.54 INCI14135.2:152-988(+)